ncbi:hypothetical protein ACHHYP_03524 [Achlya hypogyna]|uniref:Uncharacterized protein n=1 Tax=Achlya hypogyna TaxID=1202772 RepID=A0A1V9Z3G5_ACHHY|nr:hypothetical protein ACHHYP_03524 [Achlya hypogyna]
MAAAVALYAVGYSLALMVLPALLAAGVFYRADPATRSREVIVEEPPPVRRESPETSDATSDGGSEDEASARRGSSPDCLHMLRVRDEVGTAGASAIVMNSVAPVPFENDLFRGHVYFLVKTEPPNPMWHHLFDKRKRMFWIQVQGQFKKQPEGVVYLGGELPGSITLGFFTRSLASVIMSIIQTLVKAVHYAFGDAHELPHCVFPLYQSVDEMVITPAGTSPPTLGQEAFGETKAEHLARMKTPFGTERYDLEATYTFHFHTMYVDLTQWKIINLPGMKDVQLTTFFETHPLRLVCYDVGRPTSKAHEIRHKDYVFCFSVAYSLPDSRRSSTVGTIAADGSDDEQPREASAATASTPILGVPFWLELLDFGLKKRSVQYLVKGDGCPVLQTVHSLAWRPQAPVALHVRSRLRRYSAIEIQRRTLDRAGISGPTPRPFAWTPASATRLGVRIPSAHRAAMIFQQETLRAYSGTFLRQEFLVLTTTALHLYRTQSKAPAKSVPLAIVLRAAAAAWAPGLAHTFIVDTLYETLYLAVPSPQALTECLRHVNAHKPAAVVPTIDDLPAMWAVHTTYTQSDNASLAVVNARQLCPTVVDACPVASVERLLQAAIGLNMLLDDVGGLRKDPPAVADKVAHFLDAGCCLRGVDLARLARHEDRVCFYLNVYQVLLWHAKIAFGVPKQWLPFRRRVCYQVGPLTLSLADIEHGILRAKLPPSVLVPPWPKAAKAAMAVVQAEYGLQHPDFRLSLVLHVLEPLVTFFDAEFVHEQLNAACSHFLQAAIRVDEATRTIVLPKLCEWHRLDFGAANTNGLHCARKLLGFVDGDLRSAMQRLVDTDPQCLVKYA